jgi:thiol:disulfide interchange protein DsbA
MTAQDTGQLTNLYVRLGADRAKFDSALASIGVQAAISAAGVKAERLKLEGTPTLYVDGKYEVMRSAAISDDDILQILDALVVKARAARRAVQK